MTFMVLEDKVSCPSSGASELEDRRAWVTCMLLHVSLGVTRARYVQSVLCATRPRQLSYSWPCSSMMQSDTKQ